MQYVLDAYISNNGGLLNTFYLAFSASLLGVSGFESSANFVEEQGKGVFRKTLRNMLIGVAIFNPLIALVVLNSMPFESIAASKDFLLANAAQTIGGSWLQYLIAIDAFLVLSGAVLTAYVGVSGLMHRMASDSCLPSGMNKMNSRGSFPRIVLSFFILCSSILLLTGGDLLSLAGVYTISFLGVMSLFALGNLILRQTRTELKRTYHAPVIFVVLALLATTFGIIGNIRIDPNNLHFFEVYFIPAMIVILIILFQDQIVKYFLRMSRKIPAVHTFLTQHYQDVINGTFVIFIHHVSRLYEILDYINRNETGWNIILVHCRKGFTPEHDQHLKDIENVLPALKQAGVFPHLNISLLFKDAAFGPKIIDEISKELGVRKNRIMIGSIHHYHPYDYADLGGVRIIF